MPWLRALSARFRVPGAHSAHPPLPAARACAAASGPTPALCYPSPTATRTSMYDTTAFKNEEIWTWKKNDNNNKLKTDSVGSGHFGLCRCSSNGEKHAVFPSASVDRHSFSHLPFAWSFVNILGLLWKSTRRMNCVETPFDLFSAHVPPQSGLFEFCIYQTIVEIKSTFKPSSLALQQMFKVWVYLEILYWIISVWCIFSLWSRLY